jgi:hypothetical protein
MTETAAIESRLNLDHIVNAAATAADVLAERGYAIVELTPGDATRYEIVIAKRGGRGFIVSLASFNGRSYPWDGQPVHPSYVTGKWTNPTSAGSEWTGVVLAYFLNRLAERLLP